MLNRRALIATVGVGLLGLVGAVSAFALGPGHGGRHGMMKRFVSSMIDEVLDEAQVTPEQRARIHAARDRALAVIEEHGKDRQARFEEGLALFEADQVDPARLAAFRADREAEHRRVADAISEAIAEAHEVLTPAQRKVVTDWVRSHRLRQTRSRSSRAPSTRWPSG